MELIKEIGEKLREFKSGNRESKDLNLDLWSYLSSGVTLLVQARLVCHEIDLCGYAAGFTLETFESKLIQDGDLLLPLSPIRQLDDELLIEDLRIAVKNNSVDVACQLVDSVLCFRKASSSVNNPRELFGCLMDWSIPHLLEKEQTDLDTNANSTREVHGTSSAAQDDFVVVSRSPPQWEVRTHVGSHT